MVMSYWVGMGLLITTLVLCITSIAKADMLEVEQVSFSTYHVGTFRTDDFPDTEDKNTKGLAFGIGLTINDYVKWRNNVWTNGNDAKLYTVGWEYDIEVPIYGGISLFHYHHSQHSMDEPTLARRFPLRNYYGVRFNFTPGD